MARNNTVDEQSIPQIAANLLLVKSALGIPELPYLLMVDIVQHTTSNRSKALDVIGNGKIDGLWSEIDSPGMGMKPLMLSQSLMDIAGGTKTTLTKETLLALLERHDLTTTEAFINAWVEEQRAAENQEQGVMEQHRSNRLHVLAGHARAEHLLGHGVPSPLSMWICRQTWDHVLDPSSNRTELKRAGYLTKTKHGSSFRWSITKKAQEELESSQVSPSMSDNELQTKITELTGGVQQDGANPPGEVLFNAHTRRRLQAVANLKELTRRNDGSVHSTIITRLYGHHYPDHKDGGTGYASRVKRRYGTIDFEEIDGQFYWFVTKKGEEQIKQYAIAPSLSEDEIQTLLDPREQKQQDELSTLLATVISVTQARNTSAGLSLGVQITSVDAEIEELQTLISQLEDEVKRRYKIRLVLANAQAELTKLKQDS